MTREMVERELNKIGWQKAKHIRSRNLIGNGCSFDWITCKNDLIFETKSEATDVRDIFYKIVQKMDELEELLAKLPDFTKDHLDFATQLRSDKNETTVFDQNYLAALGQAIEVTDQYISADWDNVKSGRPPDFRAKKIAERVAEVFVLGTGELPSPETKWDERHTSYYSIAVGSVLDFIGSETKPRYPCDNAIKRLKRDNFRLFTDLRNERSTALGRRRKSLNGL